MGLSNACAGLKNAVAVAISSAGVIQKGQVGVGYPVATELVEILANNDEEWQASVYPLPGSEPVPTPLGVISSTTNTPTLTASVASNVVTLAGAIAAGVPVHIGIDNGQADVVYTTIAGDTLTSVATALRDLVNALSLHGVTATSGVGTVTIAGVAAASLSATVVGGATVLFEVNRIAQHLRVSVWAPDNVMRATLADAIIANIGTVDNHTVMLSDGTGMDCFYGSETWSDQSSPSYSLYVSHLTFACEYSVVRSVTATQIAAGIATESSADGSTLTRYTSGGSA